MNREEALKLIEATATDFNSKQHVLRGLTILARYDSDISPQFEHDQMYCCDFDETVAKMSREDVIEMAKCGWFEDEDSWSHF